MLTKQASFTLQSPKRSIIEITQQIASIILQNNFTQGLCNVFLPHTSASLIFCENYDADVLRDLEQFMTRLVPDGDSIYQHTAEGADDMPAHVRMVLTQNSLMIPITHGQLQLGTWQGIFLWEHRHASHARKIIVTLLGE